MKTTQSFTTTGKTDAGEKIRYLGDVEITIADEQTMEALAIPEAIIKLQVPLRAELIRLYELGLSEFEIQKKLETSIPKFTLELVGDKVRVTRTLSDEEQLEENKRVFAAAIEGLRAKGLSDAEILATLSPSK